MKIYMASAYQNDPVMRERVKQLFSSSSNTTQDAAEHREGRGAISMDHSANPALIAKSYFRGGFIANFNRQTYFGLADQQSRMLRELRLLEQIQASALPGPKPVAVGISRTALCYSGKLVTEFILDSETLAQKIRRNHANIEHWQLAGAAIKAFHKKQIFHPDLNATNILFNEKDHCYLIDFDKGCEKKGDRWKQKTLERLHRSIQKIDPRALAKHWSILLDAYRKA